MDLLLEQLQLLTATKLPACPPAHCSTDPEIVFAAGGLSYSQLNELLLSFCCDRVSKGFFNYFLLSAEQREQHRKEDYDTEAPFRIETMDFFVDSVERFRKFAMLKFGNIKFAFKYFRDKSFSCISQALKEYEQVREQDYSSRPVVIAELDRIAREDTYLLGYIAGDRVRSLQSVKDSGGALSCEDESLIARRDEVVRKGIINYKIYLCYDYMDVYVATSMRRREEFYDVYDFVQEVFNHREVEDLKLRYFDPTQADPQDRIDKSLIEGLMVKRAKCTIYCAQESDTFGKDSELAATMAQGKPVIAYVPKIDDENKHAEKLRRIATNFGDGDNWGYLKEIFLHRHPRYVLENQNILTREVTEERLSSELAKQDKELYERRARTLSDIHPLSLQVNLETGVANGLLVVRDAPTCAKILRGILLRTLECDIEEYQDPNRDDIIGYVLKERITRSIFRVVTGDPLLTNAFWNFYPEGTE